MHQVSSSEVVRSIMSCVIERMPKYHSHVRGDEKSITRVGYLLVRPKAED